MLTPQTTDQVAAALEGFFWPKIFWDFATKNLDGAVKPIPVLQIINLLFGLGMLALEWPLGAVAGTSLHRSLEFRLIFLPLTILTSVLMYQSTNPAIYYLIGLGVYFWAYSEGEVSFFVLSAFFSPAFFTPPFFSLQHLIEMGLTNCPFDRLFVRNLGRCLSAYHATASHEHNLFDFFPFFLLLYRGRVAAYSGVFFFFTIMLDSGANLAESWGYL